MWIRRYNDDDCPTTTTTTTTTPAGQTLSLTSRADSLVGGAGDDTIDGGTVNEGGVANVQTLGATDTIDGGAGTDTLTFEYGAATTPLSISNVEHIRMTDIDAGNDIINFANVTGMTTLSVIGNSTLADANNVAAIVTLNLTTQLVVLTLTTLLQPLQAQLMLR